MNEVQLKRNDTTCTHARNMRRWHCCSRNCNRDRRKRCAQYSKTTGKTNNPFKRV
jgi:hypothetical protein